MFSILSQWALFVAMETRDIFPHWIGGNLKLTESNADRKRLKYHIVVLDCQFAVLTLIDPCYSTLATVHDRHLSGVIPICSKTLFSLSPT